MQIRADIKLSHNQAIKRVLNYLKGTATQGVILKPDPEKGIECYVGSNFACGCNQEELRDPNSVLSRTGYVITYVHCPIIWESRLQTEIAINTIEVEYIALLKAMRYILPLVGLMKKINFILKLQGDTLKVLCSLFENQVTVH